MTQTTYTAAIGLTRDVLILDSEHCDVTVIADMDTRGETEMPAVATTVRVDDEDAAAKARRSADEILRANGWERTGDWTSSDNADYARVERA